MNTARHQDVLLIALSLIALVLLIDQITKYLALAELCVTGGPAGPLPCTALQEDRLVDMLVWSVGRYPTFLPIIDLDFHLNRNAALSMPIPGPVWFENLLLVAIMLGLSAWLWREGGRHNAVGIGLILGGAIGNFLDRLVHGAVVDFLALHFGSFNLFIFNMADGAITLGVLWLFVEQLLLKRRRQGEAVVR